MKEKFIKNFLHAGLRSTDSAAKIRAIKVSNLITLSAIVNSIIITIFFWYWDPALAIQCVVIGLIYCINFFISYLGRVNLGRVLNLITANLVIFYFGSVFRGESGLQYILFSLSAAPFMFFSFEEKRFYLLSALTITLLAIGEGSNWGLFPPFEHSYDLKWLRLFCLFGTVHQIIGGYYYFLKQSVKFENESIESLKKLETEHQKQIQVQKMSSLGEMASVIAHELNNPLTIILGKSMQINRELKTKLPDNDSSFKNLEKIDLMVIRAAKIIKSLKSFSRNTDKDQPEKVKLGEIIEMTLDLCHERMALQGIELKRNIESGLTLMCRPTEISQVLLNILNNSSDALEDIEDGCIEISSSRKGIMVEILVSDNGSGISELIRNKIMQPFFSTKDVGKGTGLGLSISKGLIEDHQGELNLLSGDGLTTFQILLPA